MHFLFFQYVHNLDQMTVLVMSMSDVILYVPPGTVCIECSVGGEVAADATFQLDNTNIDRSIGRVVDGVLVVFDTENVFTTSATDMQCTSVESDPNVYHSVGMYLKSKSYTIQNHSSIIYM